MVSRKKHHRSHSTRVRRGWSGISVLTAISIIGLTGCVTVIVPPRSASEPVDVFVVDHGRTTSLVVPASDGTLVRYAYGDWNWYALGNQTIWRGIAAVLWPTQGALGRGKLNGPGSVGNLRAQISSLKEVYVVSVERARLLSFSQSMENLYDSARHTEAANPAYGLSFVHHPRSYTWFWNSNHAVASWLRELGCETRGLSFNANWRVVTPDPGGDTPAYRIRTLRRVPRPERAGAPVSSAGPFG